VFYAPAVAGLLGGEKLGCSPLCALFLGRLMMLAAFLAVGTTALALARAGAPLLFSVLTLPTTVNLAGSYNQDALLTATCALAVALLTRTGPRSWCGAVALLSLVACVKLPYAPLLLFCLLPVTRPGLWRRAGGIALACLPPHPSLALTLPIKSICWLWPHTWPLLLGMVGCDHTLLRPWEYPWLIAGLVGGLLATAASRPEGRIADAGLALLALFATFLAVELSLYITYDTAGVSAIIGVEGRYFLLFLPFFTFLPGRLGKALPRGTAGWFCLPAVLLAALNAYALPAYVFHLFRMNGP
jgi:hypothetical protein